MWRSVLVRPDIGCWSRCIMGVLALLTSAACQSAVAPQEVARAEDWRVVEWVGEVRVQPPGDLDWQHVANTGVVPAGSRIITGRGARLILAQAGRQVITGAAGELRLPQGEDTHAFRHSAGQIRYRIDDEAVGGSRIETSFAVLEVAGAVLDLNATPDGLEVRVTDGEVRIATPDGLAATALQAGQGALGRRRGQAYLLARRGADGEPLPVSTVAAVDGASTTAKQRAPEARLLARRGSLGHGTAETASPPLELGAEAASSDIARRARGPASAFSQRVSVARFSSSDGKAAVDASVAPQPLPASDRDGKVSIDPPPAPQVQLVAEVAPPPIPMARPMALLPVERPATTTRSGEVHARGPETAENAAKRWSELSAKNADVVIVPASYRKARTGGEESGGAAGGLVAPETQERAVETAQLTRSGAGAPNPDEHEDPFYLLIAGQLEGLAPAPLDDGAPSPSR